MTTTVVQLEFISSKGVTAAASIYFICGKSKWAWYYVRVAKGKIFSRSSCSNCLIPLTIRLTRRSMREGRKISIVKTAKPRRIENRIRQTQLTPCWQRRDVVKEEVIVTLIFFMESTADISARLGNVGEEGVSPPTITCEHVNAFRGRSQPSSLSNWSFNLRILHNKCSKRRLLNCRLRSYGSMIVRKEASVVRLIWFCIVEA